MLPKIVISILFLVSFVVTSQENGLSHYERKIDLPEIYLPSEVYDSEPFHISFPDSLYTFATIKLKKVILPTTKVSIEFVVDDDHFVSTKISVKKGKKNRRLLALLENKLGTKVTEKNKQCFRYNEAYVKLEVHKEKRTFYYVFTLENCH